MEPVQLAAVLAAVILIASVVSVELGVTVALFELGLGIFLGNVLKLAKCRLAGNMCASRAPVMPEASGRPETSTDFYGLATAV